jgi:hypothetical protein
MGATVTVKTKCKDVNILQKALQNIFGWDKFEVVTAQEEKEGKRLKAGLYGGVGNNPIVLKVKKEDLKDKEGRRAVFSDFIATRNPDGTLDLLSDKHNFDSDDQIEFVTPKMIAEINEGYTTSAIDTHLQSVTTDMVQDWAENGDNLDKIIDIDEDEIQNIQQANYL